MLLSCFSFDGLSSDQTYEPTYDSMPGVARTATIVMMSAASVPKKTMLVLFFCLCCCCCCCFFVGNFCVLVLVCFACGGWFNAGLTLGVWVPNYGSC